MRLGARLSVRARLLLALGLLAVAVLTVGTIAWGALTRGSGQLERLHDETLEGVDSALTLSRQAADLATLAPWLLTLDSPWRIAQNGQTARDLADAIAAQLGPDDPLRAAMADTSAAIADLVREVSLRAMLKDRTLRLDADLARAERRFAALAAQPGVPLPERQDWLMLQRGAVALLGASRAENLVGVGENHREFHRLAMRLSATAQREGRAELAQLSDLALGPEGLFEMRRQELTRQIGAEAALVRIRKGAAAVATRSAEVTEAAKATIAAERADTTTAIALAKSTILLVGIASAALALAAALFVSGYVTANLRAISDAMILLASGDRTSRLPRGEGQGDEIGKLFHAFRTFRANALRLDRSNRQMAQRTALFGRMMAGIQDGVAILSDQGQIVAHNDRLAQVLRIDATRLTGRPLLADVIATANWQTDTSPDGTTSLTLPGIAHAERRDSPLPGGGSVVLIAETTERRQVDDRLRQIQRIEALGKVSGEVAHDFGNILSTISSSLHLMEGAPPERQGGLRQTIVSAVEIGSALTGRLLAFARRQHLAPETVDLPSLVEGMADLAGFALRDEIELVLDLPDTPLPVRVDPGQLESAILNLCLNAGQAIVGAGRITLKVAHLGDQALLSVSDTGVGMPPEVLAHAMEPFFTARTDGTGTGLGLAMVYGFIRQSGGDIAITSAPSAGTSVQLMLPLERTVAPPLPRLGPVLLVEDDSADRAAAQGVLGKMTPDLRIATTAKAAQAQLGAPLDLLVTDLTLHGQLEGWALAEAALTRWPDCRAIVISGHLPQINPLQASFAGRVVTMTKPLTAERLWDALAHMTTKENCDDHARRRTS